MQGDSEFAFSSDPHQDKEDIIESIEWISECTIVEDVRKKATMKRFGAQLKKIGDDLNEKCMGHSKCTNILDLQDHFMSIINL